MKKANRVWAGFVPLLKVTFPLIALLSLYAVAVSCYHKSASLTAANQILSSALGWGFNASEDASLAVLAEELRTANRELKLLREDHGNMLTSLAGIGKGLESRSDSKTGFELETGSGAQSGATSEKESGDAETVAQLQVELETLRRKMDDVMAVGNTPLTPMSLARSELVFPPNPPVTGKPYTLTLHAKSIRGNDISTGGVELYARLTGPALVAADVEDFRNGSYELTFLPPLEGEYVLDFVLFYEHYDRSVRKWEATDFSGEFVKGCMYQCHDSGDSDTGPGGEKAELYANCMNICREYSSGPALRDERRREEGVKIVGDFEYIKVRWRWLIGPVTSQVCGIIR